MSFIARSFAVFALASSMSIGFAQIVSFNQPSGGSATSGDPAWLVFHHGFGRAGLFETTHGANTSPTLQAFNRGRGVAGWFQTTNVNNTLPAMLASSGSNGDAMWGYNNGKGRAGFFQIDNAASDAVGIWSESKGSGVAVYGLAKGTGMAGLFHVQAGGSINTALYTLQQGLGRSAYFQTQNSANTFPVLEATTNGAGNAGVFSITNVNSGGTALRVYTVGTGRAIHAAAGQPSAHAAYLEGNVQVVNGRLMPSVGTETGISWPNDPGGGTGDFASIKYFVRTGEDTTLQIATGNDGADDIRFDVGGINTLTLMPGVIGIKTTAPDRPLVMVHSGYGFAHRSGGSELTSFVDASSAWFGTSSNTPFRLMAGNAGRIEIASGGNVGIGLFNAAYRLELPNTANTSGRGRANAWDTYSSVRWKEDIRPIETPLDLISRLEGVRYRWKEENGGTEDFGFIAEEVAKVLPEIVRMEEDGEYAMGMDYSRIVPLLVESVKLLKQDNSELREMLLKALAEIERIKTGK